MQQGHVHRGWLSPDRRHRSVESRRHAVHHRPQEEHLQALSGRIHRVRSRPGAGRATGLSSLILSNSLLCATCMHACSAEKLEGVFTRSAYISQMFVYGDSYKSYLVGVVVLDLEALGTPLTSATKELSSRRAKQLTPSSAASFLFCFALCFLLAQCPGRSRT